MIFKALAEYVMRGRFQAICIALIGSLVPLMSQAVLGLVTLRKGWQEGFIVSLWASLPAFVGLWYGEAGAPLVLASIAVFFVAYLCCCILRYSVSWPITTIAMVAISSAIALLIAAQVENLAEITADFFRQLVTKPEGEEAEEAVLLLTEGWTQKRAAGLLAYWVCVSTLLGLYVARWLQSVLYNPGGFQQEFHGQRSPILITLASVFASLYCVVAGAEYYFWAGIFSLPLFTSGLGLSHWLIARYRLGVGAIVAMYLLLPIASVVVWMITSLAVIDTFFDLRKFLRLKQSED